ncbi:MAG TPA: putative metallopeptidase [Myxococcales bacterium]|jgi:predicted metallopeptidase
MAPVRRPNITRAVRAVIQDVAKRLPEYSHVKASRILVVGGEARRASWGTIRPLGPLDRPSGKPVVRVKGRQMLYVVTLRPRWFRVATFEKRVETILHELFHISKRFDGTLHSGRRHTTLRADFDKRLGPLVKRYLAAMPAELRQTLSWHGTAVARQWLEKPGPSVKRGRPAGRKVYTEKHLFLGPVQMISRPVRTTPRMH